MKGVLARVGMGLLYVWLGGVLMTMVAKKPIEAPFTLGDVTLWAFGVLWYWASFAVGREAKREGRSRIIWTIGAATCSPLGAWLLLRWYGLARDQRGSRQSTQSDLTRGTGACMGHAEPAPRGGFQFRKLLMTKTFLPLVITAILMLGTLWWWARPAPESLTQQLWRECHDTLAYTHPEWNEGFLALMVKQCMDQRLMVTGPR